MIGIAALVFMAVAQASCPASTDVKMTKGVVPEYPSEALSYRRPSRVIVLVNIGVDGKPKKVSVTESSGNPYIDRSALTAARLSEYAPKIEKCVPVEGTYIYRANFDPAP